MGPLVGARAARENPVTPHGTPANARRSNARLLALGALALGARAPLSSLATLNAAALGLGEACRRTTFTPDLDTRRDFGDALDSGGGRRYSRGPRPEVGEGRPDRKPSSSPLPTRPG